VALALVISGTGGTTKTTTGSEVTPLCLLMAIARESADGWQPAEQPQMWQSGNLILQGTETLFNPTQADLKW